MKNEKCTMRSAPCRAGLVPRSCMRFVLHFSWCILAGCAGSTALTQSTGGDAGVAQSSARAQVADDTKKDDASTDDKKKKKDEPEDGASSWKFWDKWFVPQAPPGEPETLVLRGDKLEHEKPLGKNADKLAGAHELYRQGDYDKARALFHVVADNPKNPAALAEEARFYEAESLRRLNKYPKAVDTYHRMLQDFPSGGYRELGCQRMFDIANFWLKDTRAEMEASETKKEGFRFPSLKPVVHWEPEKPFIDEEGRALEALENVHLNDPTGPLADKSLFLAGSVKFYREDYREADHYFTQLTELHPNSPLCEKAIELAIISKHLGTGGADYDGRKVAEARQLIDKALRSYPKLANDPDKRKFLSNQLACCTMQQAEKDFKVADFYRRTGHPGSAYFYYEIVRRRYPGTPFADQATQKMWDLRKEVEKKQQEEAAKLAKAGPPKETPPQPQAPPKTPAGSPAKPETAPPQTIPPNGLPAQPETAPQPRPLPPVQPAAPPPNAAPVVPMVPPPQSVPMEGLPTVPRPTPPPLPGGVAGG